MDALKDSISRLGILVPLVVYESSDGAFTLLDGERRLKCATELGLREVPVSVTSAPSETDNILLMFNIHSLREQWDPYTIAIALEKLMKALGTRSSRELSALTGFSVGSINRSKKLLRLPEKYREQLREELGKPKAQQLLTEDFFLELSDAVSAIRRHQPSLLRQVTEDDLMDAFVERRQRGELQNIVDLRAVTDVANYDRSGISQERSLALLERIVSDEAASLNALHDEVLESNKQVRAIIGTVGRLTSALSEISADTVSSTSAAGLLAAFSALREQMDRLASELGDR